MEPVYKRHNSDYWSIAFFDDKFHPGFNAIKHFAKVVPSIKGDSSKPKSPLLSTTN